jgi:uncharacterized protein
MTAEPTTGQTTSAAARIFIGPSGIRAGWSVLLFLLILCAMSVALYGILLWAAPLVVSRLRGLGGGPPGARTMAGIEGLEVVAVLIATCTMAAIERRSPFAYGLADRRALARFGAGLACGFVALSTLVGMLAATGHLSLDGVAERGATAVRDAVVWGGVFLLVGVLEELLTRGYLLSTLARGIRFWPAAILISILFGALHGPNGGENVMGLVGVGVGSFMFCFSLWWSGSLWWAIGFHASWDWAQSYFYGTADSGTMIQGHLLASHPVGAPWLSGGADGPEGSILVFVVIAGLIPVIMLTLRRKPATMLDGDDVRRP